MTDLRTRIEQRITDLNAERAIAEAVGAKGLNLRWESRVDEVTAVGGVKVVNPYGTGVYTVGGVAVARCAESAQAHLATQDPATTIARVDRELAGCAADLALLDVLENAPRMALGVHGVNLTGHAWAVLNARYPSEESS